MQLDFTITHEVVLLWTVALVTLVIMVTGARLIAKSLVSTGKYANLVEATVDFVRSNIVDEFLGHHGKAWFSFFGSLFLFILTANMISKIPWVGVLESPTRNINVTAALAVMVFVVVQAVGIIKFGLFGYFKKKLLLPGANPVLQILFIPIMVLVLIAEPFSLAVRLFANMLAGHLVLLTFASAPLVGGVWLLNHPNVFVKATAALPFALSVILKAFELFVAFIQAFIFTLLSALYMSESLEEHH